MSCFAGGFVKFWVGFVSDFAKDFVRNLAGFWRF